MKRLLENKVVLITGAGAGIGCVFRQKNQDHHLAGPAAGPSRPVPFVRAPGRGFFPGRFGRAAAGGRGFLGGPYPGDGSFRPFRAHPAAVRDPVRVRRGAELAVRPAV